VTEPTENPSATVPAVVSYKHMCPLVRRYGQVPAISAALR
jgi:hypothetical protein